MNYLTDFIKELNIHDFFEENGLSLPPIPANISLLKEYSPHIYSTEAIELFPLLSTLNLSSLDFIFPATRAEDEIKFFACGFQGKGIQSWHFCYLLDSEPLQIAIALPWANAYSDAEYDLSRIEMAYLLIEACFLYSTKDKKIRITLDTRQCLWEIQDNKAEVIKNGNDLSVLMDFLLDGKSINDIENKTNWIKI